MALRARSVYLRLTLLLSLAAACFATFDFCIFYTRAYTTISDPASSSGSFDRAIRSINRWPADRSRDVLVLGDSRIYAGLDTTTADAAAGGVRFLNGGVPGLTPRCWFYFDRAVDPEANRFRAIVLPFDSYGDDTSAIGSLDADDHRQDLHAIVSVVRPADILPLARSFDEPELRRSVAFDMLLRGPIFRDDFQALLSDPFERFRSLARDDPTRYDPRIAHPFSNDLRGLRADFARGTLVSPTWVSPSERIELEKQILRIPERSESYASYRQTWLWPMIRRYVASGTPVVLVRIPTRPVHRSAGPELSGSIADFVRDGGGDVRTISQATYLDLERPELFADHDHLNRTGSRLFSAMLGHDVEAALRRRAAPSTRTAERVGETPPAKHGSRFHDLLAGLGIGTPIPFQSVDYVLFFIAVLACIYVFPQRARTPILILASYYFYLRWNGWYVVFLGFLTVTDYLIGLRIESEVGRRKTLLLSLGIGLNLAFLASFKYLDFASSTMFALLGRRSDPWLLSLVVPIGISFHTFQSISYLVDVASRRIKASRSPLDYCLYIAFFPQLLAGPIVRAGLFLTELRDRQNLSGARITHGLEQILTGFVKKLVVADQFAPCVDAYFTAPAAQPSATAAWCAAVAFAVQIYFDFSGYSDIAIGSARLLGFDFPENFRRPYLAVTITDFWRRWHMTLSSWLRDYLYIPLGGSRGGSFMTARNLMVTMLLGGLWHGASWTFVAWGAYHGALLATERAFGIRDLASASVSTRVVRTIGTFVLVLLGWVLFRAQSFDVAFSVYRAMVAGGIGPMTLPVWPLVPLIIFVCVEIMQERGMRFAVTVRSFGWQVAMLTSLLVVIEMASWPGVAAPFIYFRF